MQEASSCPLPGAAALQGGDHCLGSTGISFACIWISYKWIHRVSTFFCLCFVFVKHTCEIRPCFYFIYLFWGALGLCCCTRAFCSCGEQRLLSGCSARASHGRGFSRRGAQALELSASVLVTHSLSCGMGLGCPTAEESSFTRDQTRVPCTGRQILIHWTTRKSSSVFLNVLIVHSLPLWYWTFSYPFIRMIKLWILKIIYLSFLKFQVCSLNWKMLFKHTQT